MRAGRDKRELTERNRRMLEMRQQRATLREIAEAFGVSIVRAHAIIQRETARVHRGMTHIFRMI